MSNIDQIESHRVRLQSWLDSNSTQDERNANGQFATPTALARQILQYAAENTAHAEQIRFLDPGIGTGAFYSALLSTAPPGKVKLGRGYEIDTHLASAAMQLWSGQRLDVRHQDFTTATSPGPDDKFNLVICNPPYVRHHHIGAAKKEQLQEKLRSHGNMTLSGLAGLYTYFMGLAHPWMEPDALAGWLIPSEFMDVNYGQGVRSYLTNRVTLLHIHRFDPEQSQFKDALVSSAVVWFVNSPPPEQHTVRMTFGGTLDQPQRDGRVPLEILREDHKWSRHPESVPSPTADQVRLADLFEIKRGIATGNNRYFVITEQEAKQRGLPAWALKPVLPGARKLQSNVVDAASDGTPLIEDRLFLLDCDMDEPKITRKSPALTQYLQQGKDQGVADTYLCSRRTPWYSQEKRAPAPFLCTYMGRTRKDGQPPFRFILNHSQATALNVYLMMYPKGLLAMRLAQEPDLKSCAWEALNSINPDEVIKEGRVYGGGLRKVEPKELGRVGAQRILDLLNA